MSASKVMEGSEKLTRGKILREDFIPAGDVEEFVGGFSKKISKLFHTGMKVANDFVEDISMRVVGTSQMTDVDIVAPFCNIFARGVRQLLDWFGWSVKVTNQAWMSSDTEEHAT